MRLMIYLLGFCLLFPGAAPAYELIFPRSPGGAPMPLSPALEACHSNPPDMNGIAISSEIISYAGIETEVADDFIMDETREILRARWWGSYW